MSRGRKPYPVCAPLLFLLFPMSLAGQTTLPGSLSTDTFSLQRIFTGGRFSGQIRQFSMFTDNAPGLSDYHAIAAGASLHYETRRWRGFALAMGGGFVTDLLSSDFTRPDPVTGAYDRYDAGLYEVLELDNKEFLSRLEDLNIGYCWSHNRLVLGKQTLKTPFVNPQDGRMNASLFEGLYGYFGQGRRWHVEGGWLWKAAPRSTSRWFDIAESIGVYSQGVTDGGQKAAYRNEVRSAGLLVANTRFTHRRGNFDFWNYYLDNVLNTAFLQWTTASATEPQASPHWDFGVQIIRQDAVGSGGNADPAKTYAPEGMRSWTFSGFAAWSKAGTQFRVNGTRITGDGRLLFPREWGREPLFTFLPRERNEGLGDVWAVSGQFSRRLRAAPLVYELGAGYYRLPDVKNYRLNKYGLPSYAQINLDVKYRFPGRLKGLEAQLLAVWKTNAGDLYGDERYRINKVDMANYNLIFNYHFDSGENAEDGKKK